jgi:hypothetical protein
MNRPHGTLRRTFAVSLLVAFGSGVYAARAYSRHAASTTLSFVGQLLQNDRPVVGRHALVFRFKKSGTAVCSSPSLDVDTDGSGSFQVEVPISSCASSLFDGSPATVDILADGEIAAAEQPVTHVPYAIHASQLGLADCPAGYDLDPSAQGIVLCRLGESEVVRVGTGATAFWVDRYEASVWSDKSGTGIHYDGSVVTYPATFPPNGQWTAPLYAVSKRGVAPSVNLTWFQALEACAASGKRLPIGDEWLRAARGTADNTNCQIVPVESRKTGAGLCVSAWGAEDMIGNVTEMTNEWFAGLGDGYTAGQWPAGYNDDYTANIVSAAHVGVGSSSVMTGIPSCALRGGATSNPVGTGVFAITLDRSPTNSTHLTGFRCVIPR